MMNASTNSLLSAFELGFGRQIPRWVRIAASRGLCGNVDSLRRVARWVEARAYDMATEATKLEARRTKKGGK